ncbi:MAG: hypothetical protein KAJ46_05390 [Sedimentisphaerales bacterium]|nr:hypothetical protein [Sedimentisphaerales bacterium]
MKRQTQQEADGTSAVQQAWRFRREITLGTLVQLGAILIALTIGWSNLQSELALIRHDLNRLIQTNERSQRQIENLAEQSREQGYRIKTLEEKT